jgi:hypothetical protein
VNVAENLTVATRAATVTITSGTLSQQVTVTQAAAAPPTPPASDTPPHAASSQTWTIGSQTWSDAINIPSCNKTSFNSGSNPNFLADCRSYNNSGATYYYYSWPYVNEHKGTFCPSPWRVPSNSDFMTLAYNTTKEHLASIWGYSGYAVSSATPSSIGSAGSLWSSEANTATAAYSLYYYKNSSDVEVSTDSKGMGYPVRCVK